MSARAGLRAHLLDRHLAGTVTTRRADSLRRYRLFAAGDPGATLGLVPRRAWTAGAVLELMARRVGVDPDPAHRSGPDRIDPERTLDALDACAARLAEAVRDRAPVLVGTGHPGPLLPLFAALVGGVRRAGCPVPGPALGARLTEGSGPRARTAVLTAAGGVLHLADEATGEPLHSHSPLPIRTALSTLAEAGVPPPALVVGDHGWVCGAGQAGVAAIGFADANDPALFVGEAEGDVAVSVPLDDGLSANSYSPIARYLLQTVGLSE